MHVENTLQVKRDGKRLNAQKQIHQSATKVVKGQLFSSLIPHNVELNIFLL